MGWSEKQQRRGRGLRHPGMGWSGKQQRRGHGLHHPGMGWWETRWQKPLLQHQEEPKQPFSTDLNAWTLLLAHCYFGTQRKATPKGARNLQQKYREQNFFAVDHARRKEGSCCKQEVYRKFMGENPAKAKKTLSRKSASQAEFICSKCTFFRSIGGTLNRFLVRLPGEHASADR